MRRLLAFVLILWYGAAAATTPAELTEGLGEGAGGRLSMLFEVTMFGIDVADVDAYIAPDDAAAIAAIADADDFDDDTRERVAALLLEADPCVVSMRFLRDAGWDRFMSGTKKNLESAVKDGMISEQEFEAIWQQFAEDFAGLDERGVKKGDAIFYRIDEDRVQTVYFAASGEVLVHLSREGPERARATRGAYFGPNSDFSEKLIKSLERD